ncbi:(Fe-S)-binding protein [Profundibacter amoris]|uniref:(Fe-S)-binding protein n=1 Tax=Profundibacter amoris TaxID=2171755 RepID=A0A347UK38_9RHOB|nr:(Fe-S)-binding protein [Profundibacter amoris]AXX99216.1 (Fe-S)-binding protein [Profundibacter amoris]
MSSDNKAQIAVDKFLQFTDGEVASFFEACVHCGECAEACHFYMATKDPKYTPTYKLFPMVKAYKREKAPLHSIRKMFGLLPPAVTEDELREWETLVYDSCTMCGRCTMVCPMGIDIAGTIRKMREGYAAADIVPDGLKRSVDFVEKTGSPMGVTPKALLAQIAHQEKETGIKIEVDKQGADYMAILSSMEIMGFPEIIGAYAKIFKKAGISWTISTKAYEATNVGVQIGSGPLAKEIVTRVVDAAEELGVKYVISPECGHAYGAIRWAGPNMVGRPFKFEVVHIIELLDQLRRDGKIPAGAKDGRKMTLHDPCQIIRRGGLLKEPRSLLDDSCSDFVEMENAGLGNLCCGGGGGVSANPRAADLQNAAFGCKADQLNAIDGLEAVVVPCANCRTVFEEGLEERDMDHLEVLGLGELVAETLKDIEQAEG